MTERFRGNDRVQTTGVLPSHRGERDYYCLLKSLVPVKLDDPEKLVKQFWDNINNTQKVNLNILSDKDVSIVDAGAFRIIRIDVPRADRHDKPVYIGQDRTTLKLHVNTVSADNSAENSAENSAIKLSRKEKEVFDILLQNPQITTPEIAVQLGLPRQTVTSRIKTLKEKGVIRRIGSPKGGHWEIVTK